MLLVMSSPVDPDGEPAGPFTASPGFLSAAPAAGDNSDMAEPLHVLVVEDEKSVRDPLVQYLSRNGCRTSQAKDAQDARRQLMGQVFDLVLLDIMMPGEDGFSLCRHIREAKDIPVILLTAKGEETDRIVGLEIGADDYVVKPFNPRELLARIKGIVRRTRATPSRQKLSESVDLAFGTWTLRTGERHLVSDDGVVVPLSSVEFTLLMVLIERPRMVLSREQLLDMTRGRSAVLFDRSIDNQISRLRKKIEADPKNPAYIKTVWGGGYSFATDVQPR